MRGSLFVFGGGEGDKECEGDKLGVAKAACPPSRSPCWPPLSRKYKYRCNQKCGTIGRLDESRPKAQNEF